MHKIKNKKLLSIFMAGIISYACVGIDNIYANENSNKVDSSIENSSGPMNQDDNTSTDTDNTESEDKDENNSEVELKDILVNDINNDDNIGLNIKTKGNITKIEDNKIYIKDESGEGIVYLEDISVNNLKVGDCISIIGIVNQVEELNVVVVNDVNNIDLIIVEDNTTDEENKTEDNLFEDENKDNITNDKTNKPNKPSTNQGQSKPSNSGNVSKPSNNVDTSKSDIEEIVLNSIKGKDAIVIESDLSSSQWEKVKLNLEENNIKVKDLKNNKIRITQVNNELGDNIWIVNDPRMEDLEEETKTIGIEITQTLLYSEYDVSESKWNTIVEDVQSGSAKIKYDSDRNIKVIYQKGNGKDYTITLNRIESEE